MSVELELTQICIYSLTRLPVSTGKGLGGVSLLGKKAVERGVCVMFVHSRLRLRRGSEKAELIGKTCQESEILGEKVKINIIICCWGRGIKRCEGEIKLLH